MLSSLFPHQFDPTIQTSNLPAPTPHISVLPLRHSDLNPPPPPSVSIQGQCRPLLLLSVAHARANFLPALRLQQCVPPPLPSNGTDTLAKLSALPLQRGRPRL